MGFYRHVRVHELRGGVPRMVETQNRWVLDQLEKGQRLSSRNSVIEYGIQDLPKRISELRQMGHKIESATVSGMNRHGRRTRWAVYWMVADD